MWHTCHIWMSHVTSEWVISRMNESRRTYQLVMSHIWMSHVTHIWMSHVTHIRHMNGSPHLWMSHVTYECVTSQTESCHTYMSKPRDTHTTYDWEVLYIWMSHVTYECVTSHTESCHTHMNESHDTHTTYEWVMSHMNASHRWLSHVTHIWMSHVTHIRHIIGWCYSSTRALLRAKSTLKVPMKINIKKMTYGWVIWLIYHWVILEVQQSLSKGGNRT